MTSRILLVSPGFHGYFASIRAAFETLGYDVDAYCYDAVTSKSELAWNKFVHELPAKLRGVDGHMSPQVVSQRAIAAVREANPDIVLVIRGDIFTEEFWAETSKIASHIAVWMYDEIRRTAFEPDVVGKYARLATYSKHDTADLIADGHPSLHVPLGFDDQLKIADTQVGAGVVSFIGAPFAKRENALLALAAAGVPVRAWGRGWSNHPFDRARTWRVKAREIPNGRDVPGSEALAIMKNSVATLNIHGDQDGFTMRTFEAAGVGALQFIDRADVDEFYVPGEEVVVFESHEELIEQARRALSRPQDFSAVREKARERTLAEHTLRHRAKQLETLWA